MFSHFKNSHCSFFNVQIVALKQLCYYIISFSIRQYLFSKISRFFQIFSFDMSLSAQSFSLSLADNYYILPHLFPFVNSFFRLFDSLVISFYYSYFIYIFTEQNHQCIVHIKLMVPVCQYISDTKLFIDHLNTSLSSS